MAWTHSTLLNFVLEEGVGVERNQNQDNLQGQEFLYIYLEQIHVQGIQIQVQEFLAGKSSELIDFYEEMPGKFFPCALHLESESESLTLIHRN